MTGTRIVFSGLAAAAAIGTAAFALTTSGGAPEVERVDFGTTMTATTPAFDARVAAPSAARVREFRIPMTHRTIEIAPGVNYDGWTFGNTVPGPVIRVRQGDLVKVTLVNESDMPHSIDFHAARIPMDVAFKTIGPGESFEFEFTANDPGTYMVHCGTPPVLMHIMQGMYLPIIVDPKDGWGTDVDKEFVLTQSEFYAMASEGGNHGPDWNAAMKKDASHVVFNGRANQYQGAPLEVDVGDRVRFFVMNAGPSLRSDFHIVGAVFDRVYPDGNPKNALNGVQTYTVPAGGGAVFESVFEEGQSGEGVYAFVTHAFADASKGAVGLIKVGRPTMAAGMSH
ncbi:MAG TPA: multicopper oxidase domain-containing protein [Longimicrobiales bacterium]|nr:multicopper oxidase domain-containing protein [Longimicrobiales bacterium]